MTDALILETSHRDPEGDDSLNLANYAQKLTLNMP